MAHSTEFNVFKIEKEFDNFTNTIDELYEEDDFIPKEKFLEILPEFLNTSGKLSYIRTKMPANIKHSHFVKFLKNQTMGKDFVSFNYLIKALNLKVDKYDMIVFNDRLNISNVRKEALFIWWVLRILHNNMFIKNYNKYLVCELQKTLDEGVMGRNAKRYDLYFNKLRIILEVDEDGHDSSIFINDNYKDNLCKVNGLSGVRLSTKNILKFVSYTNEQCDVPAEENELAKFREALIHRVKAALMRHETVRDGKVLYSFQNHLINQMYGTKTKIGKCKKELKNVTPGSDEHKLLLGRIDALNETLDLKIHILEDLDDAMTIELFKMKDLPVEKTEYNISMDRVYKLFNINEKEEEKTSLYEFAYGKNLLDENGRISWLGLSKIIIQFNDDKVVRNTIKNVMLEYYLVVESIYKAIMKDLQHFYETCLPNIDVYREYEAEYADKVHTKKTELINKLNNDYAKLEKDTSLIIDELKKKNKQLTEERNHYKNRFEFYEKKKKDTIDVLEQNGKSAYGKYLLDKLECIKYDFTPEYNEDKEFEKDFEKVKNEFSNLIVKYDHYYDRLGRKPVSDFGFDIEKILKDSEKFHLETELWLEKNL